MKLSEKLLMWLVLNEKIENAREEIVQAGQSISEANRTLKEMMPGKERAELACSLSKLVKSLKKPQEERCKLIMIWKKLDEDIDRLIKEL